MELPEEIYKIIDAIVNAVPTEEIYLFGSYAYGTPHQDSDYDFYVVFPEDGMRPADALTEIGMAVAAIQTRSVDLLGGRRSNFEKRRHLFGGLERTIAMKGLKLYEHGTQRT